MSFWKKLGKIVGGGLKLASNVLPPGLRQVAAIGGSALSGGNTGDHARALVGSLIPGGSALNIGKLANTGLQLASAYQGMQQQGRADRYQGKAVGQAEGQYAERAPLRTTGLRLLSDMQAPDLSQQYRSANAFAARPPIAPISRGPSPRVLEAARRKGLI